MNILFHMEKVKWVVKAISYQLDLLNINEFEQQQTSSNENKKKKWIIQTRNQKLHFMKYTMHILYLFQFGMWISCIPGSLDIKRRCFHPACFGAFEIMFALLYLLLNCLPDTVTFTVIGWDAWLAPNASHPHPLAKLNRLRSIQNSHIERRCREAGYSEPSSLCLWHLLKKLPENPTGLVSIWCG